MSKQEHKLGTFALTGIVLSAMLGGGVFSLPQNMAQGSAQFGVIISWIITGIGMSFIANSFRLLTELKPEHTTGLYSYAYESLGSLAGFISVFGYWISNCFAMVAYANLMMSSMSGIFPSLKGGNSLAAIFWSSIVIWVLYGLTSKGVKTSTLVNNIGTILKIAILAIFIFIVLGHFDFHKFTLDFFGKSDHLGNLGTQIKSTMLVTLWLFFGIEGAVVVSGRAKSQQAVKKATSLGFIIILVLYALVSLLPYAVFSQKELASMSNPSMATIMTKLIGPIGGNLINLGIFVAVASSWIVWLVLVSEMPAAAASSHVMPKYFTYQNRHGAFQKSLLVSSLIIQIMLILSYFFNNAWDVLINVTASMALPCYLFSMIYLAQLSKDKQLLKENQVNPKYISIVSVLAIIYTIWLIYAANITYLVSTLIIYFLGLPIYIYARKQSNQTWFTKGEKISLIIGFIILVVLLFFIKK